MPPSPGSLRTTSRNRVIGRSSDRVIARGLQSPFTRSPDNPILPIGNRGPCRGLSGQAWNLLNKLISRSRLSHNWPSRPDLRRPERGGVLFLNRNPADRFSPREGREQVCRQRSRPVFPKLSQIQGEGHFASEPSEFFVRASRGQELQSLADSSGNAVARRLLRPSEQVRRDLYRDLPWRAHSAQFISIDTTSLYVGKRFGGMSNALTPSLSRRERE